MRAFAAKSPTGRPLFQHDLPQDLDMADLSRRTAALQAIASPETPAVLARYAWACIDAAASTAEALVDGQASAYPRPSSPRPAAPHEPSASSAASEASTVSSVTRSSLTASPPPLAPLLACGPFGLSAHLGDLLATPPHAAAHHSLWERRQRFTTALYDHATEAVMAAVTQGGAASRRGSTLTTPLLGKKLSRAERSRAVPEHGLFLHEWRSHAEARRFTSAHARAWAALLEHRCAHDGLVTAPAVALVTHHGRTFTAIPMVPLTGGVVNVRPGGPAHATPPPPGGERLSSSSLPAVSSVAVGLVHQALWTAHGLDTDPTAADAELVPQEAFHRSDSPTPGSEPSDAAVDDGPLSSLQRCAAAIGAAPHGLLLECGDGRALLVAAGNWAPPTLSCGGREVLLRPGGLSTLCWSTGAFRPQAKAGTTPLQQITPAALHDAVRNCLVPVAVDALLHLVFRALGGTGLGAKRKAGLPDRGQLISRLATAELAVTEALHGAGLNMALLGAVHAAIVARALAEKKDKADPRARRGTKPTPATDDGQQERVFALGVARELLELEAAVRVVKGWARAEMTEGRRTAVKDFSPITAPESAGAPRAVAGRVNRLMSLFANGNARVWAELSLAARGRFGFGDKVVLSHGPQYTAVVAWRLTAALGLSFTDAVGSFATDGSTPAVLTTAAMAPPAVVRLASEDSPEHAVAALRREWEGWEAEGRAGLKTTPASRVRRALRVLRCVWLETAVGWAKPHAEHWAAAFAATSVHDDTRAAPGASTPEARVVSLLLLSHLLQLSTPEDSTRTLHVAAKQDTTLLLASLGALSAVTPTTTPTGTPRAISVAPVRPSPPDAVAVHPQWRFAARLLAAHQCSMARHDGDMRRVAHAAPVAAADGPALPLPSYSTDLAAATCATVGQGKLAQARTPRSGDGTAVLRLVADTAAVRHAAHPHTALEPPSEHGLQGACLGLTCAALLCRSPVDVPPEFVAHVSFWLAARTAPAIATTAVEPQAEAFAAHGVRVGLAALAVAHCGAVWGPAELRGNSIELMGLRDALAASTLHGDEGGEDEDEERRYTNGEVVRAVDAVAAQLIVRDPSIQQNTDGPRARTAHRLEAGLLCAAFLRALHRWLPAEGDAAAPPAVVAADALIAATAKAQRRWHARLHRRVIRPFAALAVLLPNRAPAAVHVAEGDVVRLQRLARHTSARAELDAEAQAALEATATAYLAGHRALHADDLHGLQQRVLLELEAAHRAAVLEDLSRAVAALEEHHRRAVQQGCEGFETSARQAVVAAEAQARLTLCEEPFRRCETALVAEHGARLLFVAAAAHEEGLRRRELRIDHAVSTETVARAMLMGLEEVAASTFAVHAAGGDLVGAEAAARSAIAVAERRGSSALHAARLQLLEELATESLAALRASGAAAGRRLLAVCAARLFIAGEVVARTAVLRCALSESEAVHRAQQEDAFTVQRRVMLRRLAARQAQLRVVANERLQRRRLVRPSFLEMLQLHEDGVRRALALERGAELRAWAVRSEALARRSVLAAWHSRMEALHRGLQRGICHHAAEAIQQSAAAAAAALWAEQQQSFALVAAECWSAPAVDVMADEAAARLQLLVLQEADARVAVRSAVLQQRAALWSRTLLQLIPRLVRMAERAARPAVVLRGCADQKASLLRQALREDLQPLLQHEELALRRRLQAVEREQRAAIARRRDMAFEAAQGGEVIVDERAARRALAAEYHRGRVRLLCSAADGVRAATAQSERAAALGLTETAETVLRAGLWAAEGRVLQGQYKLLVVADRRAVMEAEQQSFAALRLLRDAVHEEERRRCAIEAQVDAAFRELCAKEEVWRTRPSRVPLAAAPWRPRRATRKPFAPPGLSASPSTAFPAGSGVDHHSFALLAAGSSRVLEPLRTGTLTSLPELSGPSRSEEAELAEADARAILATVEHDAWLAMFALARPPRHNAAYTGDTALAEREHRAALVARRERELVLLSVEMDERRRRAAAPASLPLTHSSSLRGSKGGPRTAPAATAAPKVRARQGLGSSSFGPAAPPRVGSLRPPR